MEKILFNNISFGKKQIDSFSTKISETDIPNFENLLKTQNWKKDSDSEYSQLSLLSLSIGLDFQKIDTNEISKTQNTLDLFEKKNFPEEINNSQLLKIKENFAKKKNLEQNNLTDKKITSDQKNNFLKQNLKEKKNLSQKNNFSENDSKIQENSDQILIHKKKVLENKQKQKKCNCSKNNCLRLHCLCFKRLGYCSPECNCKNCFNVQNFDIARDFVIKKTKLIYKEAFSEKLVKIDRKFIIVKEQKKPIIKFEQNSETNKNKKNPKTPEYPKNPKTDKNKKNAKKPEFPNSKTNKNKKIPKIEENLLISKTGCKCKRKCQKNYCECKRLGGVCSSICRCEDCLNNKIFLEKKYMKNFYRPNLRKKHKICIDFDVDCVEKFNCVTLNKIEFKSFCKKRDLC